MKKHSFYLNLSSIFKARTHKKIKYPLFFTLLLCINNVFATDTVLLLGDSISAGYGMEQNEAWVTLLNAQLEDDKAPYKILNASISGETTSGGLSRLPGLIADNDIRFLLIELGGNDGLRGYSPKVIKNNLLQIIDLAKQNNITVFLMHIKITPNYGPRYNKMFEQIYIDVAQETQVTPLPFFMNEIALKKELMQDDAIHPNKAAQPFIKDIMVKQLNNLIIK